jgi:hypothetical protein
MISGAHGIEHLENLLESQYTSLGALPFNLRALESTEVIVSIIVQALYTAVEKSTTCPNSLKNPGAP